MKIKCSIKHTVKPLHKEDLYIEKEITVSAKIQYTLYFKISAKVSYIYSKQT
jgi:hypothetical protein